jgi:hypothetical protein
MEEGAAIDGYTSPIAASMKTRAAILVDAEHDVISVAEPVVSSDGDRLVDDGLLDAAQMAQLSEDDVPFELSLVVQRDVLPLTSAADSKVRAGWLLTLHMALVEFKQLATRPISLLLLESYPAAFARDRACDEDGPSIR